MFGLSWPELLVVAVVAVLAVKPEDLPGLLREGGRLMVRIRRFWREITEEVEAAAGFDEVKQASREIRDVQQQMRLIPGDDGKDYPAYDVQELQDLPSTAHTEDNPVEVEKTQSLAPAERPKDG